MYARWHLSIFQNLSPGWQFYNVADIMIAEPNRFCDMQGDGDGSLTQDPDDVY